ncbi:MULTISPECIES: YheC/YheD family endospore coat-associated protein [Bacillus]|uniref:YheC/YheD family endospore coat-associated protein n=1 Tax=Bacillus TaxID=1386 RepID=UPI002E1DA77A|nr:YheC/YheD family protein [Bacillus paralicheniformis]
MTGQPLTVGIHQTSENTMLLPASFKQDGLLFAAFGTSVERCHVSFDSHLKRTVLLSENLYKNLRIPYRGKASLIFRDNTVYIGPLIGIFTAGFTKSQLDPVRGRSLFFSKLLTMDLPAGGYSYLFGAHQIDWEEGTVQALIFRENGWEEATVPLPNVVYDRLPNRKAEESAALRETKTRLMDEYRIPWFNPGFFNKWEIYKCLQQDERTAELLPFSAFEPDAGKIEDMIGQYGFIYVKPAGGSLGKGILQLSKREENGILARHAEGVTSYSSAAECLDEWQRLHKHTSYLAQQGIERIEVDHHPADFRVHTNKNGKGQWTVTAIAVKIAGKDGITTHMSSGGAVKTLAELYDDPQERLRTLQKLTKAALLLSRVLDEKLDGFIGEIGFDLGLDRSGKVWLFEANSRPGRGIFSHPRLASVSSLTKKRSFEYASYLTEQSILNPEDMWHDLKP